MYRTNVKSPEVVLNIVSTVDGESVEYDPRVKTSDHIGQHVLTTQ